MNIVRRIPMDFRAIAKESGISKGKVVFGDWLGWGVQNDDHNGIDFGCITPPSMQDGEDFLKIVNNEWCFCSKELT